MVTVEFKKFSAFYKTKGDYITALSDVDLFVKEGEFLAIVGKSGSGKSTLIKSCLGIAEYFKGDLLVGGESVEYLDFKSGRYAYVSQEYTLYPNLTVFDNIAFPLRNMQTPIKEIHERVKKYASLMDISYLLTRKPKQLSGGQQQRVAICRALVRNPALVLFDEPLSSIEPTLRREMRDLFKKMRAEIGCTVIYVTHDLNEAFYLGDRVVCLEDGKISDAGTFDELKSSCNSNLLRLYFGKPLIEED